MIQKTTLQKVSVAVVSLLLTVVTLELLLASISRVRFGADHRKIKLETRRSFWEGRPAGTDFLTPTRSTERNLQLHPLFGYTLRPELEGVNNYGFQCQYAFGIDTNGYHLVSAPTNRLVVGIFGGSFAFLLEKHYGRWLEDELKTLYPGRTPIVVNFAFGGHALPQSAAIFFYFRSMVDVAVFCDGVNEPWNYVQNNLSGAPPEFAKASHYFYKLSAEELTPERFELTQRITDGQRFIRKVTEWSLTGAKRKLLLTHYLWKAACNQVEKDVTAAMTDIQLSYAREPSRFHDLTDEEIAIFAAAQWSSYHQLIHDVCRERNIFDIHLLQPSPFLTGSKRDFTQKEIELMANDPFGTKFAVDHAYPAMRRSIATLKRKSVRAIDLSMTYSNTVERVWRDPWHVIKKANRPIAEAVLQAITQELPSEEPR